MILRLSEKLFWRTWRKIDVPKWGKRLGHASDVGSVAFTLPYTLRGRRWASASVARDDGRAVGVSGS